MITDILKAVWRGVAFGHRTRINPSSFRHGDLGQNAHHTFGYIVNVSKIALHIAVVVNIDWPAFEYRLGEYIAAISARPHGPYTVINRNPIVGNPYK